jgi:hypothetical protein
METTPILNSSETISDTGVAIIIIVGCLLIILLSFICVYICFYDINREPRNCIQICLLKIYNRLYPQIHVYDLNYNQILVDQRPVRNFVQHFELPNEDPELECPICFEKIGPIKCHIGCEHPFHEECIKTWIINNNKTTCPICRNNVVVIVV